ncbi:hypothetical protein, partial [Jiangella anatolica]|uniref:hypothetical protein n=1 Tax=Jiangella anatolica TaxID=2670374 RepID=UPI001F3214D7
MSDGVCTTRGRHIEDRAPASSEIGTTVLWIAGRSPAASGGARTHGRRRTEGCVPGVSDGATAGRGWG